MPRQAGMLGVDVLEMRMAFIVPVLFQISREA